MVIMMFVLWQQRFLLSACFLLLLVFNSCVFVSAIDYFEQGTSRRNVSSTLPSTLPSTAATKASFNGSSTTTVATTSSTSTRPFITGTTPKGACLTVIYPIENDPENRTIVFNKAMTGIVSQTPCPNNPRKLATWKCTVNGWSHDMGQPDLTECVSLEVTALLDQVNSVIKMSKTLGPSPNQSATIVKTAEQLENLTSSSRQSFLAGDLMKIAAASNSLAPSVVGTTSVAAASDMLQANSNLMGADIHSAWEGLPFKERGLTLSNLFNSTETLSFATVPQEQPTKSNKGLAPDSSTTSLLTAPNKTITTNNFEVNMIPVDPYEPVQFSTDASSDNSSSSPDQMPQISIDIKANMFDRMFIRPTVVSLIVYNSVHTQVERLNIGVTNNTAFNSPIFTLALGDENGRSMGRVLLPDYFVFASEHRYSEAFVYETTCSYYDTDYGHWLQRGCHQVSKNETHTVCACDHLTTFAILVDFTGKARLDNSKETNNSNSQLPAVAQRALFNISIIGCALSIVALFLFVLLVAVVSRQNTTLRVIYCNFGACLLIAEIIFLAGADKVHTGGCVTVGVMLQFFFTATFMWSGAIAFYFVLVIYGTEPLTAQERRPRWPYFLIGCYFITAMLIGATWITSAASGDTAYGNDYYCWINLPYTWFFISPVAFLLVFNFGVLAAITFKTCTSRSSTNYVAQSGDDSQLKLVCRAMVGIVWTMLILCATWVLGFFYVSTNSEVVEFIFVVLNSFQGVLVLVFYIVTNRQIKLDFAMFCRRQSWLPQSIRTWASYQVSSMNSSESWHIHENNSKNGRTSSYNTTDATMAHQQDSRELSSISNKSQ